MKRNIAKLLIAATAFIFFLSCNSNQTENETIVDDPANEVIYHVVQRSFYDSNGDLQGDLNGLREKLDYLQELGITSVLLLPLYESEYYHNYFSGDFEKIDPEFGSKEDYFNLVKELHRRGMKLYMDMETQYVTEDHIWFKDSYKNPKSQYSDYLIYNGPDNTNPESIIFNLTEIPGHDGKVKKATTVNLNSKKVWEYNYKLFKYWADPNGDGNFDDGVDGFRFDHMMDDLDEKGKLTGLFQHFWKPLVDSLKKVNPKLKFVAEQAYWGSFGFEYFKEGGVDRVFAFRIADAIRSFDKNKIATMADSTFSFIPDGKEHVVFLSNHDMDRFSNVAAGIPGKLKIGAALNLFIGGIPSIYYGQEIGMRGAKSWGKYGMTDANDIPIREAFEWFAADSGNGMALWHKGNGPWWDDTNLKPNDGISLEEQKNDSSSLWNFYKKVIRLRRTHSPFVRGLYQTLNNNNSYVLSFLRYEADQAGLVIINLSSVPQQAVIDISNSKFAFKQPDMKQLMGKDNATMKGSDLSISLPAYSINVWEIK